MEIYNRRIKELREDNDIKQQTIAKYLNISQTYYSKYERGVVPIPLNQFIKICTYYKVSADYIIGFTNKMNRENDIKK